MSAVGSLRIASVVAALLAGWLALHGEAAGEETGGALTGPFDLANGLGVLAFLAAAACAALRPRSTFAVASVAALLVLPMQTWRLAPGLWCGIGNCSADYPAVQWNAPSALTLINAAALLAFAALLRRRAA